MSEHRAEQKDGWRCCDYIVRGGILEEEVQLSQLNPSTHGRQHYTVKKKTPAYLLCPVWTTNKLCLRLCTRVSPVPNLHLVDFGELDSLLLRAAAADGGNIEHSIPELDKCPPVRRKRSDLTITSIKNKKTWIFEWLWRSRQSTGRHSRIPEKGVKGEACMCVTPKRSWPCS